MTDEGTCDYNVYMDYRGALFLPRGKLGISIIDIDPMIYYIKDVPGKKQSIYTKQKDEARDI